MKGQKPLPKQPDKKSKGKTILLSFFCFLFCILFTSCEMPVPLNQRLLIRGIGIDWQDGEYLATLQADEVSENSQAMVVVYTSKGNSVLEALRNVTKQEGKIPQYSHDLTVVFGEGAAQQGLNKMIDFFLRNTEIPSASVIIVCQGNAQDILSAKKEEQIIPADTLGDAVKLGTYNGQTAASDVASLVNHLAGEGESAYLPYMKLVEDVPMTCGTVLLDENGIQKDILDDRATRGLLLLTGQLQNGYISVYVNEDTKASLEITGGNTEIKVDEQNGNPVFTIEYSCKLNVTALEGDFKESYGKEYYQIICDAADAELRKNAQTALNQCIFENKLDVLQMGRWMHKQQPSLWNSWKKDWKESMDLAEYVLDIETNMQRVGKENTPSIE